MLSVVGLTRNPKLCIRALLFEHIYYLKIVFGKLCSLAWYEFDSKGILLDFDQGIFLFLASNMYETVFYVKLQVSKCRKTSILSFFRKICIF